MTRRVADRRIRLLFAVFGLLFVAVLGRAAWLQVVRGDEFDAIASRQHLEPIEIPAGRGTIFDRTGAPLAIGQQATTVYADPRSIENPRRAAVAAAHAFGLDADELYERFVDRSKRFVYVQRKADPVRAAALQQKKIAGLGFYPEELRWYPQDGVAAHVLGFAGVDNTGLEGLERSRDRALRGAPGREVVVRDALGRAIDVLTSRPEQPGRNITVTLDHQLQANAEQVLAATVRRWGAKGGTAIVADVRTGAVLAMANAPTFDANRFAATTAERRRNRAVTDLYEPGSTFKLVTIAAALEDGLVAPSTTFVLPPQILVADRWIHEAHERGTETMTVRQILADSSNVGTVTIAGKLGREGLAGWIRRFGFGRKTGIDFPGESAGMALPLEQWSGSTIGTVPIGQGIAVTPMQMVAAYAAIGNGGVMRTPHLVAKVGGKRVHHGDGRRVVSRATADRVMAMLRSVVVEGTGTEAAIPGYTVAGKTGTASKVENGRYVAKYVASFVGLVPARKPQLAILVAVDEPHGAIWGGVVAAPAFAEIAQFALQYLEVAPDAPETKTNDALVALGSGTSDAQ
jgi:cell division protein FtsI (penicillin-binding protein 3)